MITIKRYTADSFNIWNEFIENAKNGHFIFDRNYMEYHSDRFIDHSLMFYDNNKLLALMPNNIENNELISHAGLSFGGIISSSKMTTKKMLAVFQSLKAYCLNNEISNIIYKAVPYIYHKLPASEDLYALFMNNAKLYRRDASSTIILSNKGKYYKGRKSAIKKSKENRLIVRQSLDFVKFMEIERTLLNQKHGINPVHTGKEITLLAAKFPGKIKLFTVIKNGEMLGGTIIFENGTTAHCQYISATEMGKELGVIDITIDYLINVYYKDYKYFDFGISTEKGGRFLNNNLIRNKESFGASTIVFDFYKLKFI